MEEDLFYSVVTKTLAIYGGLVAICLTTFCIYQVTGLSLRNIASNEDIRHRWNGHRRNKKMMKIYKKEAGCCKRLAYILFGNVDQVQSESKLQKYAQLVETYYEIQRLG